MRIQVLKVSLLAVQRQMRMAHVCEWVEEKRRAWQTLVGQKRREWSGQRRWDSYIGRLVRQLTWQRLTLGLVLGRWTFPWRVARLVQRRRKVRVARAQVVWDTREQGPWDLTEQELRNERERGKEDVRECGPQNVREKEM
jgi:hypothetical protein